MCVWGDIAPRQGASGLAGPCRVGFLRGLLGLSGVLPEPSPGRTSIDAHPGAKQPLSSRGLGEPPLGPANSVTESS